MWGLAEAVFGVYYQYLARSVQPAAPPSTLPPEQLVDLFSRVLRTGPASLATGNRSTGELIGHERRMAVNTAHSHVIDVNLHLVTPDSQEPGSGNPSNLRMRGRLYSAAVHVMGIAEQLMDPDEEEDRLFDGNRPIFHTDDPLAIKFREQLRTW